MLAAIVVLATALRTIAIGREALWGDEGLTLVIVHWPIAEMLMQPTDPTPFLYYALHKLFVSAGADAAGVRGVALAAGLLAIPAIYWVGRLVYNRSGGLLAAALLAVWTPHVDYSQEARAYSLLVLLTLLSAAGLLWWFAASARDVQRRAGPVAERHAALGLFVAATTASFYTHLVAVFWIGLAAQIMISLTQRRRSRRHFAESLAALGLAASLAVPGLIRLARETALPNAFHWLAQAGPGLFAETLADLFGPSGLWLNDHVEAAGAAPTVRLAVGALAAALLAALFRRRRGDLRAAFVRDPAPVLVVAALLALPLLLWLFGYVALPIFMPRTALFAVPGAILLLVGAVRSVARRHMRKASTAAVALYLVSTLLFGSTRAKEDMNGAAAVLAAHVRPGDAVVVCEAWRYPSLRHASIRPLDVPALIASGPVPTLMERNFGTDRHWSRAYFDAITAPANRARRGDTPGRRFVRHDFTRSSRASVWLVDGGCPDDQRRAVDAWVGASGRSVWQSAPRRDAVGVVVRRFDVGAPTTRPILIALPDPIRL